LSVPAKNLTLSIPKVVHFTEWVIPTGFLVLLQPTFVQFYMLHSTYPAYDPNIMETLNITNSLMM